MWEEMAIELAETLAAESAELDESIARVVWRQFLEGSRTEDGLKNMFITFFFVFVWLWMTFDIPVAAGQATAHVCRALRVALTLFLGLLFAFVVEPVCRRLGYVFLWVSFNLARLLRFLSLEIVDGIARVRSFDILNNQRLERALLDLDALRQDYAKISMEVSSKNFQCENLEGQLREAQAERRACKTCHGRNAFPQLVPTCVVVKEIVYQDRIVERTAASRKYASAGTQTRRAARKAPLLSFGKITSVQTVPTAQQVIPTITVSPPPVPSPLSFSAIKAVHSVEPVPVTRPAVTIEDAGVQVTGLAEVVDIVDTAASKATEERHAGVVAKLQEEIADLEKGGNFALRSQEERHQGALTGLHSEIARLTEHLAAANAAIQQLSTSSSASAVEHSAAISEVRSLRTEMQAASARYEAMRGNMERHAADNQLLRQQLEASTALVAGSQSSEAMQEQVARMQAECQQKLDAKDKDMARKDAAAGERYQRVVSDLKKAEQLASESSSLRSRVAALDVQLLQARGTGSALLAAGLGAGHSSNKNSANLAQQLGEMTKSRDEWRFHSTSNADKLVACDKARVEAVTGVAELERELARSRKGTGVGGSGVGFAGAAPLQVSVNTVQGKRGRRDDDEEEEEQGSALKRMR